MRVRALAIIAAGLVASTGVGYAMWSFARAPQPHEWTPTEMRAIESLWLANLHALRAEPSNAVAEDPRAAKLGHRFYFDTRFSANGKVSCATCHQPGKKFTDGQTLARGIDTAARHTPSIVGASYNAWFFWDGRRDTQWAQALTPMEDPAEHGGTRTQYAHLIARHYRAAYEELFGALPDLSDRERFPASAGPFGSGAEQSSWREMNAEDRHVVNRIYAGIGKAIAAYERRIMPGASRFDEYVAALQDGREAASNALTADEAEGLRLFIGKANCIQCHSGPLFTSGDFHNIGLRPEPGVPFDTGRINGVKKVLGDTFNCTSVYSGAQEGDCDETRFVKAAGFELVGAFKVPSLRNVADTAPYMHRGQIPTLAAVLDHYDRAPEPLVGHSDLAPLGLSRSEKSRLEAFLRTLSGPVDADPELLAHPVE